MTLPRNTVAIVKLSDHPELSDKYQATVAILVQALKEQLAEAERREQRAAVEETNRSLRDIAAQLKQLRWEQQMRGNR